MGLAPFHYGRWAEIAGAWAWVPVEPGVVVDAGYVPVYAPALVSFIGFGVGLGWGWGGWHGWGWWGGAGGWGGWRGPVGWVPLAPGEPFVPWYRFGSGYFRSVNIINVRNINIININRNVTINNFINRRAASVVPASAFVTSRRLGGLVQRADAAQLRGARPILGRTPLRPGAETTGVTRPMARIWGSQRRRCTARRRPGRPWRAPCARPDCRRCAAVPRWWRQPPERPASAVPRCVRACRHRCARPARRGPRWRRGPRSPRDPPSRRGPALAGRARRIALCWRQRARCALACRRCAPLARRGR